MVSEVRVRIILDSKLEEEAIETMKYNSNYKQVYADEKITIYELIDKDRGRISNGK